MAPVAIAVCTKSGCLDKVREEIIARLYPRLAFWIVSSWRTTFATNDFLGKISTQLGKMKKDGAAQVAG
jgi:hypothetical protein